MMLQPANLANAQVNVLTSAAANTNTTTAILGALGATQRYRIWTLSLTFALSNPAAGALLVAKLRSVGGAISWGMACDADGAPMAPPLVFPGGVRLPAAVGFEIVHACSAANQSLWCNVGYTLEDA